LTSQKLSSYQEKAVHAITENCRQFFETYGVDNVGFVTLTFPDNCQDPKEASRRFNSFKTHYFNRQFPAWLLVRERQVRGAWHYHLLVDYGRDIRTGFDFDALKSRNYRGVPSHLKKSWVRLNIRAKKFGFGRCEGPIPVRTSIEQISRYVAKYLAKGQSERTEFDKRVRLVSYSQSFKRRCGAPGTWSWGARSRGWRQGLQRWAGVCGLTDFAQFVEFYGDKWAYRMQDYLIGIDHYTNQDIMYLHDRFLLDDLRASRAFRPDWVCLDDGQILIPDTGEIYQDYLSPVPF
jgi:hypothetical protein